MMLLGIVGFFILGVLYFDVRGRETKPNDGQPLVRVENVQPQPEPSEVTGTPTDDAGAPVILTLPPQTPVSTTPAIAAYECWRFGIRDDRVIVDLDHLFGEEQLMSVAVDENTLRLSCGHFQKATVRSHDGKTTLFIREKYAPDTSLLEPFQVDTLYTVDPLTGVVSPFSSLPPQQSDDPYLSVNPDNTMIDIVWPSAILSRASASSLGRVSLETGKLTMLTAANVRGNIWINPSHTTAIGIEWTCANSVCDSYPAFLHRFNLTTGKTVRVGEVFDWNQKIDPVFIDDERVVVTGKDTPAFVMNIFTRKTAPIKKINPRIGGLAITTNGKSILITGLNQPFTVIPVSELPKP